MLAPFLLSLREGLEAALIIGILLGALQRFGRSDLKKAAWSGVAMAVLVSLAAALTLQRIGASLEGDAEKIFEGTTMLLAAGVLTWMIFWMSRQAHTIKSGLEANVLNATRAGGFMPIFSLAFLAVVREGVELALFLTATTFASGGQSILTGALLGLAAAVAMGWLIFATTVRLDLRRFFQLTGALLLLFAAGLVAHGVHEFNELGWIPAIIDPVWNINHILNDKSTLGEALNALFGYNGNPSLTEVLAYVGYFVVILLALRAMKPSALQRVKG